jgi:hypothetical protein
MRRGIRVMTLFREERGIAMIAVILMSMIVLTISIAAFQLSVSALNHSAEDKKRDEAIQAAQAAVDSYLAALPSTTKICNGVGTSYSISTNPKITYKVSAVYWSSTGSSWFGSKQGAAYTSGTPAAQGYCTSSSTQGFGTVVKSSGAKLIVVGSGTAGNGVQTVTRKWQSLIDLTAITGGTTNAFYGNTGLCITNNPTVMHQITGNDAGLYSGGDINASYCPAGSGNGSMVIEGTVYAQGNITFTGGCIDSDVWAGGTVNLQNVTVGECVGSTYPTGNSITNNSPPNPVCNNQGGNTCYFQDSSGTNLGSVKAAGGTITLSGSKAFGSCTSSGAQTWTNSSACSPNRDNTGFNPAACTGTVGDGSANCGTANASGLTGPASTSMPQFYYSAADWASPYTIVNETGGNCTTIESDIESKISSGVSNNFNLVFYINPSCALSIPQNKTFTLQGNTIIITTGSFTTSNLVVTTSSGSCTNTSTKDASGNLMYPDGICQFDVIVPYDTVASPTSSCVSPSSDPGTWDISFGNTTDLSGVDFYGYTPCWLNINQSSKINGQGVAGVINEANHFTMNYKQISVPGFVPSGYNPAPEYFRECSTEDSTGFC